MKKILEKVSDNLSVEIIPDGKFEFLMSTNEVAKGFGVSGGTIQRQGTFVIFHIQKNISFIE